ncbi:bifunctional hydroxymethylpyrimidine kinase/phosphomethylpyrimidine kinase [Planococcaceae bacterium Storch 2/2-2]|nr:bifunctional hydroxymethylpyrimidine kinase/phosphomethylpyrimidine kinase [Planococcaceae bacterium Storch 2/2-2]
MTTIALTIAGSDSGGGAGIQADLKTFQELGTFGTSVLTAITAQNTNGVHGVQAVDTDIIDGQLEAVMTDLRPKAAKTGMIFSPEIIALIAERLTQYGPIQLVVDPVMIAKGGASLLQEEAIEALRTKLVPLATVITPNIPEAEVLAEMTIENEDDLHEAADRILKLGAEHVIIKGGHSDDPQFSEDYIVSTDGSSFRLRSPRIDTEDTHGTGCTFSAAIAANLAKGMSVEEAITEAKVFIQSAIQYGLHIGSGHGPTNHAAYRIHGDTVRKDIVRR